MDLGIRDRVALVTGASSGIGRACALALAREGVRLAVAARRTQALQDVAAQAAAAGSPNARGFELDLLEDDRIDRMLHEVVEAFGGIDILIANGGGPKPSPYTKLDLQAWDAGYRSTLRSMLRLVDGVLPAMRQRRWGRIVALTSTSVKQPIPGLALSNVFRTALVAAMKTLAAEVAKDGVTVNCIAPGRILTDRLRELYADGAALEAAAREIPIGRIADPDEFAPLVAFLCGEPASYVTGQTIAIDGGLVGGLFG